MSEKIKSVITCDLDGKIETLSKGAIKLFGYLLHSMFVNSDAFLK